MEDEYIYDVFSSCITKLRDTETLVEFSSMKLSTKVAMSSLHVDESATAVVGIRNGVALTLLMVPLKDIIMQVLLSVAVLTVHVPTSGGAGVVVAGFVVASGVGVVVTNVSVVPLLDGTVPLAESVVPGVDGGAVLGVFEGVVPVVCSGVVLLPASVVAGPSVGGSGVGLPRTIIAIPKINRTNNVVLVAILT